MELGREKELEEKKYVFLARDPRLYLVGDPEDLGFFPKDPKKDKTRVDSYGVTWFEAGRAVASIINVSEEVPTGLIFTWIRDIMYYVEGAYIGVEFDEQGYQEFKDRLKAAQDEEEGAFRNLVNRYQPVETYRIPEYGTEARMWFNRIVKIVSHNIKRAKKMQQEINEAIQKLREVNFYG